MISYFSFKLRGNSISGADSKQSVVDEQPVTRLLLVGLPPRTLLTPQRDQTDRPLPRTNDVGVAHATVYRSECHQGPEWSPGNQGW